MAGKSAIEWTDATWNPIRGCTRVSPGCGGPGDHGGCYAERVAARFSGPGQPYAGLAEMRGGRPRWTGKLSFGHNLDAPLRWRRPRRIFVNSMSDLFHEDAPDEWVDQVFAVMALAPQHTFQVLTKRAARMHAYVSDQATAQRIADGMPLHNVADRTFAWPLPNVWLGVSAEDQQRADERVPYLLTTPAAVRFVSYEPALGPVDFTAIRGAYDALRFGARFGDGSPAGVRLDWIIAGGESGPNARPMHPDWARSVRDQCAAAGVAFFFKQWGGWSDTHPNWPKAQGFAVANDGAVYDPSDLAYPDGARYGEALRAGHDRAHLTTMYRLGKARASRMLDGREHNDMPGARS